jgi:hypothetical protein
MTFFLYLQSPNFYLFPCLIRFFFSPHALDWLQLYCATWSEWTIHLHTFDAATRYHEWWESYSRTRHFWSRVFSTAETIRRN